MQFSIEIAVRLTAALRFLALVVAVGII